MGRDIRVYIDRGFISDRHTCEQRTFPKIGSSDHLYVFRTLLRTFCLCRILVDLGGSWSL